MSLRLSILRSSTFSKVDFSAVLLFAVRFEVFYLKAYTASHIVSKVWCRVDLLRLKVLVLSLRFTFEFRFGFDHKALS